MKGVRGIVLLALVAAACSRPPQGKEYELKGQILALRPDRNEVVVKHEDIPGFMPAMTMPYKVKEGLLADKEPGDLITATLVVAETDAHLSAMTKTGHAAIPGTDAAPVTPGFDILREGEQVPDDRLVDENGAPLPLSSLRGHRVALTFMYTQCPFPEFCPLMDRNFVAVQNTIKESPELADVRLVSVSFDPAFDTPSVLKKHARTLRADPRIWHFVSGDPTEITRFAARFGVAVERPEGQPITHNLSTAVIDPAGRLVRLRAGNSWTPAELVADLKAAPAPAH